MNQYEKMMAEMGEKAYNEWVAEKKARQAELERCGAACVSPPPYRYERAIKSDEVNRKPERISIVGNGTESADQKVSNKFLKTDESPRNSGENGLSESPKLTQIMANHKERSNLLKKLLRKTENMDRKIEIYNACRFRKTREMLELAGVTEEEILGELAPDLPVLGDYQRSHSPPRKLRETRTHQDDRHAPYQSSRHDGSRHEERRVLGSSNSSNVPEQRRKEPREYFKKSKYTWKSFGSESAQTDQKPPRDYFKKSKYTWKSLQ